MKFIVEVFKGSRLLQLKGDCQISTGVPLKEVQPLVKSCKVLVHFNFFLSFGSSVYHVPRLN